MHSTDLARVPIPAIAFLGFIASPWFWIGLVACVPAVLLMRSYRKRGERRALHWSIGLLLVTALAWITPLLLPADSTAPEPHNVAPSGPAMDTSTPLAKQAQQVMAQHCNACHASHPTMMAGPPWGFNFDRPGKVDHLAADIYRQVVVRRAMPMGNVTHMTEAQRQVIARWYQAKRSDGKPAR